MVATLHGVLVINKRSQWHCFSFLLSIFFFFEEEYESVKCFLLFYGFIFFWCPYSKSLVIAERLASTCSIVNNYSWREEESVSEDMQSQATFYYSKYSCQFLLNLTNFLVLLPCPHTHKHIYATFPLRSFLFTIWN